MGHLMFYLVVVAMFAFKGEAQTPDVYNFYFQKGPAPATVIQGGTGQSTGASALPSAVPASSPSANPLLPPEATTTARLDEPKVFDPMAGQRYELFLGGTRVFDELGTADGYTLGGQYNFNRFVGLRGVAHYLDANTQKGSPEIERRKPSSNLWGGQLALAVTPIHLELFGHKFLKIGALGGVRSERRYKTDISECSEADFGSGLCIFEDSTPETKMAMFYGVTALVNINENFGVEASVASAEGGKAAQVTGNLAFTF